MHELPTHTVCTLKTCLLGNSGVGKSSLGLRFVENRCPNLHSATIGASFLTKVLVLDKIVVKFQIWDTAGQEDYRSLAPMYFRAAKIVLLVFDMTNPQSFHDLAYWVKVLQQHNLRDCSLGVAANKSDLYNAVDLSDTMVCAVKFHRGFFYHECQSESSASNSDFTQPRIAYAFIRMRDLNFVGSDDLKT